MMSSLATSPYSHIDHRTVFKNLHVEASNNSFKDTRTADIFNPNNKTKNGNTIKPIDTTVSSTNSTLRLIIGISPRTYVLQKSNISSLAPKTKIPYPLATLWPNQKTNNFKRSSSVRMRGMKSNLPLIMEPTINETPTTNAITVNEEKCTRTSRDTKETTTATTGGLLQVSTRRKLALISQTQSDGNVAEPALIKRSLSLRRNFKVSNSKNNYSYNSYNNITDTSKNKICGAANLKSLALHDVAKTKDKSDGLQTTTTTTPSATAPGVDKQTSTTTDILKDFSNMSLNQNGVTTQTDTIATTTIVTQQSRPLTLTTSTATPASAAATSKGLKSPKTPNTTGNHIISTSTPSPATHPHSHNLRHQHNHTSSLCKTSPVKLTPKTPPVTPDSPTTYLDDDLDSLFSYGTTTSGRSTMSCEHPYVARNGTTFSGRKMKYVVHCSNYAGQVGADYLTPTQRAQRQLRRLKELLCAARQDLEQKDSEIVRLTREVVELRLFKASLSSPEERSASSDAVTVREAELKTSQDVSPIVDMVDDAQKTSSPRHTPSVILHEQHLPQSSLHHQHHNMMPLSSDMQSSFADSGHFEDMTSSSVHSKDSSSYTHSMHTHEQACVGDMASCSPNTSADSAPTAEQYEVQRQELIRLYEQRIEDLIRNQDAATSEIKRTNCDRIEALLQKLAECNTRYADIVPDYEHAKERIRELEKQLEELHRRLVEHEDKQKQMYLHMYQKGQEAERIARADQALELAHRAPQNKVSINELLHQLQSTQDELENIRAAECRNECGNNHALLTAKEAISLWVLGARKTIYRRLLEAQKNRTHVDPEVTLQFLKSAVYYFLTDKENSQGHLQAIESILEFSEVEKQTISKARSAK